METAGAGLIVGMGIIHVDESTSAGTRVWTTYIRGTRLAPNYNGWDESTSGDTYLEIPRNTRIGATAIVF